MTLADAYTPRSEVHVRQELITDALTKLDECDELVDKLARLCCQPERSPRLAAIQDDIAEVRGSVRAVTDEPESTTPVYEGLERIGATIGQLQVGCCAPARMPLYADTMERLTGIQLDVKRAIKKVS
jgi:hypothetical protein